MYHFENIGGGAFEFEVKVLLAVLLEIDLRHLMDGNGRKPQKGADASNHEAEHRSAIRVCEHAGNFGPGAENSTSSLPSR